MGRTKNLKCYRNRCNFRTAIIVCFDRPGLKLAENERFSSLRESNRSKFALGMPPVGIDLAGRLKTARLGGASGDTATKAFRFLPQAPLRRFSATDRGAKVLFALLRSCADSDLTLGRDCASGSVRYDGWFGIARCQAASFDGDSVRDARDRRIALIRGRASRSPISRG